MNPSWESEGDFEETFSEIRKQLYKDDFFELMSVENPSQFFTYLRDELSNSDDMELLSDVLMKAFKSYQRWEVDSALDDLSEKGLIQMVLNEDGHLAYVATDEGLMINNVLKENNPPNKLNSVMDINFSSDVYKVTNNDDVVTFCDHGDNYEIVVMPAGKQHDGEVMVQFYHTIYTDYHLGGPNGEYKLVDETELFNMLNS